MGIKQSREDIAFKIKLGLVLGVTVGFIFLAALSFFSNKSEKNELNNMPASLERAIILKNDERVAEIAIKHSETLNDESLFDKLPIFTAIENDNDIAIKILKKQGADINKNDSNCSTPLCYAVMQNKPDICTLLLDMGADINKADLNNRTPAFYAAGDSTEMIRLLMNRGANLQQKDNNNMNLLHYAAYCGNIETYNFLLKTSIDESEYTTDGKSVLHYAAQSGNTKLFKEIAERGIGIYDKTPQNETMLHLAGNSDMISYLIGNYKFDINAITSDLKTPFHTTASILNERMVKTMVSLGADINAKDIEGKTPLFYATPENIQYFIDNGADKSVKDFYGKTVYDYAKESGKYSKEILGILKA